MNWIGLLKNGESMLHKTVIQQNNIKDPYCMLALAVIERAKRDRDNGDPAAIQWFDSPAYHWYLDIVSVCTGIELPYDLRPQ